MCNTTSQHEQTIVQSGNETTVLFFDTERMYWLETVTRVHEMFRNKTSELPIQVIVFDFYKTISIKDIKPFHLVTLACLIHFLFNLGHKVFVSHNNDKVSEYIYNDLGFSEYWRGGQELRGGFQTW